MQCNVLIPGHVWPGGNLRGVKCDPSPANSFPAAWFGKADVNADVHEWRCFSQPLVWCDKLAADAKDWADHLAKLNEGKTRDESQIVRSDSGLHLIFVVVIYY